MKHGNPSIWRGRGLGGFRLSRRALITGSAAGIAATAVSAIGVLAAPTPSAHNRVTLTVTPNPVAADAPFNLILAGLDPAQQVTLRAETIDDNDMRWVANAAFQATTDGAVNLARQAPIAGSYRGVDPTGLIWSALPPGTDEHNTSFYIVSVKEPPITITAQVEGQTIARATLNRELLTPAIAVTNVNSQGLSGMLFQPKAPSVTPGMLVLGGSEGGLSQYLAREAALLATHGFTALALAYFGEPSLPPTLTNIPLEYLQRALTWLRERPGVRSDRIGVMGTSRGGELALLLGATFPQIQAVVSYVGSGRVVGSPSDVTKPAWTYKGEPVPYAEGSLTLDPASIWHAAIPVEQINGPVMLIAGDADREWQSTLLLQLAWGRLRANHHPYPDEFHHYPNAGHLIRPPYLPTGFALDTYGGTIAGMAHANADSWPRIVRMLQTRLMR